jgi:hypothetical protein
MKNQKWVLCSVRPSLHNQWCYHNVVFWHRFEWDTIVRWCNYAYNSIVIIILKCTCWNFRSCWR